VLDRQSGVRTEIRYSFARVGRWHRRTSIEDGQCCRLDEADICCYPGADVESKSGPRIYGTLPPDVDWERIRNSIFGEV